MKKHNDNTLRSPKYEIKSVEKSKKRRKCTTMTFSQREIKIGSVRQNWI